MGINSVSSITTNGATGTELTEEEKLKREQANKTVSNPIITQKKEEENLDELPQGYRIERTLDDKDNYQKRVEEVQKQIEKQGTVFKGGSYTAYTDKAEYKKAKAQRKIDEKKRDADVEKLKKEYIKQGYSKKDAKKKAEAEIEKIAEIKHQTSKKLAKNVVKDERWEQRSASTEVFMDKAEYKEAKKAAKTEEEKLVKQYQQEGLSKKEAKEKAENSVQLNSYVKSKSTRRFVLENKDEFYDEKGNFSSDKYKETFGKVANINSGEDEATNHKVSIQEADKAAETYNAEHPEKAFKATRKTFLKGAKYAGLDHEKDNTNLYRVGAVAVGAAVGAGIGAAAGTTLAATTVATSAAGATAGAGATSGAIAGATSGAAAGVKFSTDFTVVGATVGAGAGGVAAAFLQDKGKTEGIVVKLKKDEEVPPTNNNNNNGEVPPANGSGEVITVCELTPGEKKVEKVVREETCPYKLKRDKKTGKVETLYDAVRDGYGLTDHKDIMKYVHVIKDRYNIPYNKYTNRTEWEMPEIEGRKFNCDAKVNASGHVGVAQKSYKDKGFNAKMNDASYNEYYYEDCDGNRSEMFNSAAKRDEEMKKRNDLLNTPAK